VYIVRSSREPSDRVTTTARTSTATTASQRRGPRSAKPALAPMRCPGRSRALPSPPPKRNPSAHVTVTINETRFPLRPGVQLPAIAELGHPSGDLLHDLIIPEQAQPTSPIADPWLTRRSVPGAGPSSGRPTGAADKYRLCRFGLGQRQSRSARSNPLRARPLGPARFGLAVRAGFGRSCLGGLTRYHAASTHRRRLLPPPRPGCRRWSGGSSRSWPGCRWPERSGRRPLCRSATRSSSSRPRSRPGTARPPASTCRSAA
jgi:hypothetical protein